VGVPRGTSDESASSVQAVTFESVFEGNVDALYRTAIRLCDGGKDDAEDLLQETALKGLTSFGELQNIEAARAWLFTILIRTNLNRRRSIGRHAEKPFTDMSEAEYERALATWSAMAVPDGYADAGDLRDRVATEVQSLHPSLRGPVVLVNGEGFTQREAAGILGVPEGTVASRLFRAHRILRESLVEYARDRSIGGKK
jgi:RNA polymerase sigma-70 factor (ECF subfamily)